MMPWRRRRRHVVLWLAVSAAAIAAGVVALVVVGDDDGPRGADAALPTTTDVISALGTAVPPPPLDLCSTDPEALAAWTAQVEVDRRRGTADAVVRFENLTDATCELDLTDPAARADGVEASVRLAPGGWGELLIGSRDSECERLLPMRSVDLELNGDDRTVLTAAVVACEPALLAFLPAEHPVERCLAADLRVAVADTGLVVSNDGDRPCVLGELISVELPTGPAPSLVEMAQTRPGHAIDGPVGPEVTAFGPGDIAYFQTLADPVADCTRSFHPARLNFFDLDVAVEFPVCTFVRLGPGRPYFGSPDGPLVDAGIDAGTESEVDEWLGELDPFRVP